MSPVRPPHRRARFGVLAAACALLLGASGCAVKDSAGNAVRGKQLFVAKCGACHVMRRAGSQGKVGPSLDAAFSQDRVDGYRPDTIRGVTREWIQHPNINGVMPAKLYEGEDALDVATYVGLAAGAPGKDTGDLANAVASASAKPAVEKGGVLTFDMDPSGQLRYLQPSATATPGKVTLEAINKSAVDHNIAVQGPGIPTAKGAVIANGGISKITVTLKPGTYTFFCSVPGHYPPMGGKLVVK